MVKRFPTAKVVVALSLVTLLTSFAAAAATGPGVRLTARGNELARTTGLRRHDFPSHLRGGFVAGRPGLIGCGGAPPADDRLHVTGYAAAAFGDNSVRVVSKVTIYGNAAMTTQLFAHLRSNYTPACVAVVAGASGRVLSATSFRINVHLDDARGYALVLRRNGINYTVRVYILGEGRIASTLLVEQRGRQLTGGTAPLALSLLVSRMED
jgi:hypothetical protein